MRKFKVEFKKEIQIRKCEYGDFRDWFYLKEDVPKPYETEIFILINEYETITCGTIPINFCFLKINLTLRILESFVMETAHIIIPEMGLKSNDVLSSSVNTNMGDVIEAEFKFEMRG